MKYIELAISAVNQPLFSGEHAGEYNPKVTIMVQTRRCVCMYCMYVCLSTRSYTWAFHMSTSCSTSMEHMLLLPLLLLLLLLLLL